MSAPSAQEVSKSILSWMMFSATISCSRISCLTYIQAAWLS